MRHHEIEAWALDVLSRLLANQSIEDARVELRREFPTDHQKAARQIAGLLNAARGANCLWLVGVDEKTKAVTGSIFSDFASWYQQVASCFVELPPEPFQLTVPHSGKSVTAILFPSHRRPFVVKTDKGDVFDVPYRVGSFTRSATRSQLLQILSPLVHLPQIEITRAWLTLSRSSRTSDQWTAKADAVFLVKQDAGSQLSFSIHDALFGIALGEFAFEIAPNIFKDQGVTKNLVTVSGTGEIRMEGEQIVQLVQSHEEIFKLPPTLAVSLTAATLDEAAVGKMQINPTSCAESNLQYTFRPDPPAKWGGVIRAAGMARTGFWF